MSNYANGLSVQATPTRDRDRLPFPHSSQPSPAPSLRQTSSSSASTSLTNLNSATTTSSSSAQVSPQTVSVDSLLKQFASSADPHAAALDQAVADRNVLSAQNTQLWKLIEKQRTGYNQILKELERIRGERDSYKGRLAALTANGPNGIPDTRQKTTSERGSRPSLDTTSSHASASSTSPIQTRQPIARHNSNDNATPKSLNYPSNLQSSRSFDPTSDRATDNISNYPATTARTSSPLPAPPASAPSNRPKPAPSPLVVPTRTDTLPTTDSPSTSIPRQLPAGDTNGVPNGHPANGYAVSSRPPIQPRKSSVADSISSVVTSGSSMSSISSPANSIAPSFNQQIFSNNSGAQHQSSSGGFNATQVVDNAIGRQRQMNASISSVASTHLPSMTSSHSHPVPNPQPTPMSAQMLTPTTDNRPHVLSRDSRISLPDEAKQYMMNMSDSPVPSPRTESFSPRSKLATSVFPPPSDSLKETGRESEFLDMDEETDEESEADEQGDHTAGASNPIFDGLKTDKSIPSSDIRDNNASDHSAQKLSPPEFPNNYNSSQSNSSWEDVDVMQGKKKETSRVGAEEFPLPPPSSIFLQRQQALAAQEAQTQLYAQSLQRSGALQPQQPPSAPASSPSKQAQAIPDHQGSMSGSQAQQASHDSHTPMAADNIYPTSQQHSAFRSDPIAQQREQPESLASNIISKSFRELPLLSSDLPHTNITVSHSFVRPNDRGKEVLSFIVFVNPGNGKDGWKVEKMYSDVLSLDQRVRNSVGKGVGKKIANLPEGKLWKDHAPAKVDQRKAVLENYLQTLIQLPVKNNDEVIAFFTSDIVKEQKMPVMQAGHKEGYLTKRGKNFGGWKTRFFVLQGPVLEYYDCRGGAHLGSITITGAQIARQHRTERPPSSDDEKEYRHAFLIVEAKKGPGGNHPRHVLCAESDEDRDSWVEMLVRYYTGTYSEDLVFNPTSGLTSVQSNSVAASSQLSAGLGQPRSSTSSSDMSSASTPRKSASRGMSREEPSRVSAMPISLLPPDANNSKLFQSVPTSEDYTRSASPSRSIDPSPIDRRGPSAAGGVDIQKRTLDSNLGLPSSLPDSSPLSSGQSFQSDPPPSAQRANSELGHYPDLQDSRSGHGLHKGQRQHSPEHHRTRDDGRKSFYPTLSSVSSSPTVTAPPERVPSPEKLESSKVKISGPMDGQILPSGFKFGKETPPSNSASSANDRREKAKSRSFWGFGKSGDKSHPHAAYPPRAVFGVPLEEALDVAQICNLPAIVFRSIQYLEAKKADQEEGIYRLSGSSAVIKNLKDRFNNEGDVDLLSSDEYWDPHAIAGLLKGFLRELPNSILTRELHLRFLSVIDFVDPQERIKELSQLIAALPLANYTLLRALTAHLILIVQNSNVNKMTMRNVGIVFSPTLGIPAGVFSLMLGEFNRVFNVDNNDGANAQESEGAQPDSSEPLRRNSRQYSDAAADQHLGLSGRTLTASTEEAQSDGDDFSLQDDSGTETTEGEVTVESSSSSSPVSTLDNHHDGATANSSNQPETPNTPTAKTASKASTTASSRGLNVTVTHSDRGHRHSRMMGLPLSPRPGTQHSPSRQESPPISHNPPNE